MPRINVEDCLLDDPRFINLCVMLKSKERAIGVWVLVARIAQSYWKMDKSLIPFHVYEFNKFTPKIIDSGLVEKRDTGYYLKGSEKYFAWIYSKVLAGRSGGGSNRSVGNDSDQEQRQSNGRATAEQPLIPSPSPIQIHNTEKSGPLDLLPDGSKKITFCEIVDIWNNMASQVGLSKFKKESKLYDKLEKNSKKAISDFKDVESWERIIEIIPSEKWRIGETEKNWKASLVWLFQKSPTKKIENYVLLEQEWIEKNNKGEE